MTDGHERLSVGFQHFFVCLLNLAPFNTSSLVPGFASANARASRLVQPGLPTALRRPRPTNYLKIDSPPT